MAFDSLEMSLKGYSSSMRSAHTNIIQRTPYCTPLPWGPPAHTPTPCGMRVLLRQFSRASPAATAPLQRRGCPPHCHRCLARPCWQTSTGLGPSAFHRFPRVTVFCSVLCLVSTQHRHQEHAEHEQRHAPHHHAQPIAAGTSLADSALAIDDETHLIPEALPSELAKRSHSELRRPWPRVLVSQDAIRDLVMESLVQYSAFVDSMCPASVTVNAINDVARFATRRSSHKTRISAAAQRARWRSAEFQRE